MHLERSGAKKLVIFATHCTGCCGRESCDIENGKSIGDFCGELQRVFFERSKNGVFYKYANLSFFIKRGYCFYKKCAFS